MNTRPLATGLLPICVGEATKFSNYATNLDKVYEVGIKFGVETDTGDVTGKIISKKDPFVIDQGLNKELKGFEGIHFQMPPIYSAIKKMENLFIIGLEKGFTYIEILEE